MENNRVPTDGVTVGVCDVVADVPKGAAESTSLKPFVCLLALAAALLFVSRLPFTLLLIILLMNISLISISAVVDVNVGVVGLLLGVGMEKDDNELVVVSKTLVLMADGVNRPVADEHDGMVVGVGVAVKSRLGLVELFDDRLRLLLVTVLEDEPTIVLLLLLLLLLIVLLC